MSRTTVAMLVVLVSCVRTPFVSSIQVHGRQLVIEKCTVEHSDDEIKVSDCRTETLLIPQPIETEDGSDRASGSAASTEAATP